MNRLVYADLKVGDIFSLTKDKKDLRRYRKAAEGATQIVDAYGIRDDSSNFKVYPYLKMTVYKEEL